MNWLGNIVNTAKHAVTVSASEINKVVGEAGKLANVAIKLFIRVEPAAVVALTPFCPEAAPIIGAAYVVAEKIESDLTAKGDTKLQMATGIFTDAVIPAIQGGLEAAGKTIDASKVAELAPDLFNAIVAENNAQLTVTNLIQAAAATKSIPDPASLAKAEADIATAVARVKSLGLAIQAAVGSVTNASK